MKKRYVLLNILLAALLLAACGGSRPEPSPPGELYELSYAEAAALLRPGVAELQYAGNHGTGFVYTFLDGAPVLVTNVHVVGTEFDAAALQVRFAGETDFAANRAEMLGYDETYDIAVLRLDSAPEDCTDWHKGTRTDPAAGDKVLLIGNSTGTGLSAFDGIVSAPEKVVEIAGKTLAVTSVTAAINAGNSGCPVIGMDGTFLGVGFAQYTVFDDRPVQDMNYMIPADIVGAIYERVAADPNGRQIAGVSDLVSLHYNKNTAKASVQSVVRGFDATFTAAGLTVTNVFGAGETAFAVGDILTAVNGRPLTGYIPLTAELYRNRAAAFTVKKT